jgi:hypothetical protein
LWVDKNLKVRTKRNIGVDALWDDHLNSQLSLYEGNEPIQSNDLMRYWEFSQRISIYPKLISENCIMIHCSAFAVNGKAFILIGPGGAGKSTIASAAKNKGYTVITDDTAILQFKENKIIAYASPYISKSGMIGAKGKWEVDRLNKDKDESFTDLPRKVFNKNLLERIYESEYWAHLFQSPGEGMGGN